MSIPKLTPYEQPLVAQNRFRQAEFRSTSIVDFESARERLPIPIIPGYDAWERMYWRAWEMAWGNLRQPTLGSGLISNYIGVGDQSNLFSWDSAFINLFGLYGRRAFDFTGTLDNFYATQHLDGFICREIDTKSGQGLHAAFDPNSTGPNIFAWSEWQYYRSTGDETRLKKIFAPLMALYRWYRQNRTWRNGLYWATAFGSGMDNQARIPGYPGHHHHWIWADASLQAAVNALSLQRIALVLGEQAYADELAQDRARLRQGINTHLWNGRERFYQDAAPDGTLSSAKSAAAYWALHDKDLMPESRRTALIQHLRERYVFQTRHPIPALSADSPDYQSEGRRWRGGVWSATNYLVVRGLRIAEEFKLAHDIAVNHLDHVCQVFNRTGTFWEYYSPESVAPGEGARPDYVGWTGISPITILLENALGISTDWRLKRVFWDRRLDCDGHYGVQNYPLGAEHTVDLLGDDELIIVTTDAPFTLYVRTKDISLQTAVSPGTTELRLKSNAL